MKPTDAILGVFMLEFEEDVRYVIHEEIQSPRASVHSLQNQATARRIFSNWLEQIS